MKSIIDHFYNLELQANESNPPTVPSQKEDEIYEKLQALLTKGDFELFEKFVDVYGNRKAEECGYYYKKGFKTAMRLMMEACNDEDEIKEKKYEELF